MKTNIIILSAALILFAGCQTELEYCWTCGEDLVDERDGQTYQTKLINGQCWMIENLRIGKCIEPENEALPNEAIEHYCATGCFANVACETGGLYTWHEATANEMTGKQGICPKGWHLPSVAEFESLTNLKSYHYHSESDYYQNQQVTDFINQFPFIPFGLRSDDGSIEFKDKIPGISFGKRTGFWSTSEYEFEPNKTKVYILEYYDFDADHKDTTKPGYGIFNSLIRLYATDSFNKNWGLCVRCIKDN